MDPGPRDDGPMARRLADAAVRSPEVAAMLAKRGGGDGRRVVRLAVLVAALAVGIAAVWYAAAGRNARRAHEAAELDSSGYLAPIRTRADPDTGEQTAPFSGFAVSVETVPPGALVTIAGVPRGEAPVVAGVDCRAGTRVEVRAEKAGFPPALSETTCRADTLVKLVVRLGR